MAVEIGANEQPARLMPPKEQGEPAKMNTVATKSNTDTVVVMPEKEVLQWRHVCVSAVITRGSAPKERGCGG